MSTAEASAPAPALPGWVMPAAKAVGAVAAAALLITLLVQAGVAPKGSLLYKIIAGPFVEMWELPDLLVQTLWEGAVAGISMR